MRFSYLFFHIRPVIMVVVAPWIILLFAPFSMDAFQPQWYVAVLAFLAGLVIFLPAQWQIYKPEQWLKSEIKFLAAEPHELVTNGIYHYIRNPQLVGIYLMLLGEVMLLQSWALFFI